MHNLFLHSTQSTFYVQNVSLIISTETQTYLATYFSEKFSTQIQRQVIARIVF